MSKLTSEGAVDLFSQPKNIFSFLEQPQTPLLPSLAPTHPIFNKSWLRVRSTMLYAFRPPTRKFLAAPPARSRDSINVFAGGCVALTGPPEA